MTYIQGGLPAEPQVRSAITDRCNAANQTRTNNGLRFYSCNARSINNKLPELHGILYSDAYDCIFITETWLSHETPNSILDPQNYYNVVRHDRITGKGGGVCAFITQRYKYIESNFHDNKMLLNNMIVFDLFLSNVKYCFVILYRPPKLSTDSLSDAEHFNRIITQLSHLNKPVFVVGDINCRNIDWSYCVKPSNNVEEIIFNTFCNNGYTQCVTCSTRGDSLLDIICTNEPVLLRNAYTTPPIAGSDHDSVVFIINVPDSAIHSHTNNTNTSCHKSVLWKQGDYESMRQFLADIKWSDILTVNFTPDDLWSAFCSILNDAIELYVPYKLCSNASQRSHCRRYCPKSVRTVRNKKLAAWRLYRKNKSNLNLRERYNKLCAQYKREIRNHEIERERTLLETNNLGDFYKYVNGKLSCPSGVGVLLDEHGQCVVDDCERAELLRALTM